MTRFQNPEVLTRFQNAKAMTRLQVQYPTKLIFILYAFPEVLRCSRYVNTYALMDGTHKNDSRQRVQIGV